MQNSKTMVAVPMTDAEACKPQTGHYPAMVPAKGKALSQIRMPFELGETLCNLHLQSEEEVALASILTSPSDATIEELVGQTIRIRAAVLTVTELNSLRVQGEVERKVMAVFVTDDGRVVSTATSPVCRFILLMIGARPLGEWVPPIECVVKSHKPQEKGKHDYYSLRIVEKPKAAKKGGAA
jgi:hypothetical protein